MHVQRKKKATKDVKMEKKYKKAAKGSNINTQAKKRNLQIYTEVN